MSYRIFYLNSDDVTVFDSSSQRQQPEERTEACDSPGRTQNPTPGQCPQNPNIHTSPERKSEEEQRRRGRLFGKRPVGALSAKKKKKKRRRRRPSSVVRGHRTVKARTVVQQCRQAKVRIRTSLDGAEAQWVEIQEGVVDYVCFYRGATEGITRKMGKI